jgi:hypothetical protein
MITQSELKSQIHYDSKTGLFTWLKNKSTVKVGNVAGCLKKDGYIHIKFNNKTYPAHRLSWLYVYGHMPNYYLDHINGCPSDNRITNLREATASQNSHNVKITCRNTSGIKGIYWHKKSKKWIAKVSVNKQSKYLGSFNEIELAELVINEARLKYHGAFARNY